MKTKKSILLLASLVCAGILACVLATTALAVDPVRISLTQANGNGTASLTDTTDILGRAVQQVIAADTTSLMMPNYRSYDAQPYSERAERQNPALARGALKLVVYSTSAASQDTKVQYYASTGSGSTWKANLSPVNSQKIQANAWTTLYFDFSGLSLSDDEFLMYFTLRLFGSEQGKAHLGDTIYIGYMGLFDSLASAQAYVTDFEGDLAITDVQVGGTSIGNVTETTLPLADPSSIPALTVTGTGNADNVVITNGTLQPDGTATSTVTKNGTPVVTVHFDSNASAASSFTNSVTMKAGYTAETSTSSEKAYAILASVQLDESVDLSAVTAIGFYGYVTDSDTVVVAMSDAATLATLATNNRRFYAVIYGIPTIDTEVILKPFVTVSGTTTVGEASSYVPSGIGADTYYGTETNIETYFAD